MSALRSAPKEIHFNTSELTSGQARELKKLMGLLADLLTTDEESELFENSARLIKTCINLIEQSNFIRETQTLHSIPYAEQAIEYAFDTLKEYLTDSRYLDFDN